VCVLGGGRGGGEQVRGDGRGGEQDGRKCRQACSAAGACGRQLKSTVHLGVQGGRGGMRFGVYMKNTGGELPWRSPCSPSPLTALLPSLLPLTTTTFTTTTITTSPLTTNHLYHDHHLDLIGHTHIARYAGALTSGVLPPDVSPASDHH
jgi:hypothetical protein